VLTPWQKRPLSDLLAEHELDGLPEFPFPTDGWSGATFSSIDRGTDQYVLKRTALAVDWIAAATRDDSIREACLAASAVGGGPGGAGGGLGGPWAALGAAADGDAAVILMPDLSIELIAWDRPGRERALPLEDLDRVLLALAELHRSGWPALVDGGGAFPWTPLPERLLLTSRPMCARHLASGIPAGIASAQRLLAGWDAFDRHAPPIARQLLADLSADVTPLVRALSSLPSVGLHGDLKLANVALGPGDRVRFIDWSMTIVAPVAVELGWFLVSNSGLLPVPPDLVLERYHAFADIHPGEWEAQVGLAMIVGLVLRGFRKGLDAEAGVTLASGISAADDLAWWCERAVIAAARLG
jgi:phosphotransferase family enzyme